MNKRRAIFFLALVLAIASAFGVMTACQQHVHNYGDWTITVQPTAETGGKAVRSCEKNDSEEKVDLPVLTDTAFWTKDEAKSTTPDLSTAGKYVYTSEYGEVAVDLPALSDAGFWTKDEDASVTADHFTAGKDVYKSKYGEVVIEYPQIPHAYGDWEIATDPTMSAGGTAEKKCDCGDVITEQLPALSDTEFWTKDEDASVTPDLSTAGQYVYTCVYGEVVIELPALTDAGFWTKDEDASVTPDHFTAGKDVYTSEYGEVVVELPVIPHAYGGWTITAEPTLDNGGTAERSCDCGHTDTKELPALSDADFWQVSEDPADYNHAGSATYTSECGSVTVATDPKKVAPYDGKTYHSFSVDANIESDSDKLNRKNNQIATSWTGAVLELDENGVGYGHASPFDNKTKIQITMVDAATGKIAVSFTSLAKDEAGNDIPDDYSGTVTVRNGYVDFKTGFIVLEHLQGSTLIYFDVLIPSTEEYTSGAQTSGWGTMVDFHIVLSYVNGDTNLTIYIDNDVVYFGVTFTDIEGAAIEAGDAYASDSVFVNDAKGAELARYGWDGEKMSALDQYAGIYHNDDVELRVNGLGTATYGGQPATYTAAPDGENFTINVVVTTDEGKRSYNVTLDGDAFSAVEATVQVSFDMNGNDDATAIDPKDIPYASTYDLPVPENTADKVFRGWYYDSDCSEAVESFAPTADTTLYAKWVTKVTVTIVIDAETSHVVELGEGDVLSDTLNIYAKDGDVDEAKNRYFVGWYMDAKFDQPVSNIDMKVSTVMNGVSIYAKWEAIPAYVGVYHGQEIYNAGSGSLAVNITIEIDGTISGSKSGTVTFYDKEAQRIEWATSDGNTNYFFFDEASGVLAYNESRSTYKYLGSDLYVLSKYQEKNSVAAQYGIYAKSRHDDSSDYYYAQFVNIVTEDGPKDVLLYDINIYSNITITDSFGNPLAVSAIKDSKTIVVVDNSTGEVILARAAEGTSFSATSNRVNDLDKYYGTYTLNDTTLKVDGAGDLMLGEKSGTYTVTADNFLEAYIDEDGVTVYYEITLNTAAKTYSIDKPMVNITLNNEGNPEKENAGGSYNKKVQIVIESPENTETYVFRGWFYDEGFESELSKDDDGNYVLTPSEDATIYAKWLKKVTLVIDYNDDNHDNDSVEYGVGETAVVPRPVKDGSKFLGWYKEEGLETLWGKMADDGSTSVVLDEDVITVTIYAKWGEAPIYSHAYYAIEIDGQESGSHVASPSNNGFNVTFDPEGVSSKISSAAPFRGEMKIIDYDEATHKFKIEQTYSGSTSQYLAVIDPVTKIIIMNDYATTNNREDAYPNTIGEVYLLSPFETKDIERSAASASYWDDGLTRAISFTAGNGNVYKIFIMGGEVYFNVSFKTALENGDDIDGKDCCTAPALYVIGSDGAEIARFGYNGTTMVKLDGYEGTYTGDSDDVVLDGVDKITWGDKEGTYTLAENVISVYIKENGAATEYWEITLDKSGYTYEAVKPMVTLTFESAHSTHEQQSVNKNIGVALPTPENTETHVFRGWYTDSTYQYPAELSDGKYIPTDDITLVAKWLEKVTVTVKHNKEGLVDDYTIELGEGETVGDLLKTPEFTDGQVFKAWHTEENFTDSNIFDTSSEIFENTTIYCEWMDAVPMYGKWIGANVYGNSSEGSTRSIGSTNSRVSVTPEGNMSDKVSGDITQYKEADGSFMVGNTYGAIDVVNGVMIVNYNGSAKIAYDIYIFVKADICSNFTGDTLVGSYWTDDGVSGSVKLDQLTLADNSTMLIFIKGGRVYGNITFEATSVDETEVTAANAYNKAKTIVIKDSDGRRIASYARGDNGLIPSDGLEGDYEGTQGVLKLSGNVTMTWGEKSGEYSIKDEENNVLEVYIKKDGEPVEYWVVTLNVGENTYTAEKPTITVHFDMASSGIEQQDMICNVNIPVELPNPSSDTLALVGWFTNADCTDAVALNGDGKYVPTGEDDVTLYGKFDVKVVITIVYGEHGGNRQEEITIVKGATPDLTPYIPDPDGNFVFGGWFKDAGFETPYEPAPVEDSITIYCGWIDQPYKVEEITSSSSSPKWVETDGVWEARPNGDGRQIMLKITFNAAGTFSFHWESHFADNYDGLYVALNIINAHQTGDKIIGTYSGSGTKSVTVQAGDILYIEAYTDNSDSDSRNDYARVSEFSFNVA